MKAILSILLCILSAAFIGYIAFVNNYIAFNTFIGTVIIPLIGTIFAIDVGIVPVLYYEFRKIEKKIGKDKDLEKAKSEVKVNARVMTALVIIAIILGIIKGFFENTPIDFFFSSMILAMQFLTIFMVYDMVDGILSLTNVQD